LVEYSKSLREYNEYARPDANPPIDLIPWLKYIPESLPGGRWKRTSRLLRERRDRIYNELIGDCRSRIRDSRRNGSFMESVIDNAAKYGLNDAQILQLGAVMLDAATETTATFLQHFIQCMVVHPEVQRQAQADIDSVIGQSRAPTLDDMQGLPYVRALIQEVFRFRSLGPVGLPHSTTTDVTIDGFFIPKNTTIFMNI